jgi:N-acetylglucosamine-6-phosphate deacetylase
LKSLQVLAKTKDDPALNGSIAGLHLEGPYISPVDGYRGAHALKSVRKPNWREFMELYEASGRNIVQVTLAPEVEGALDFIVKCREHNIVVALGHHNASTRQVTEAVDRGAQTVTHLGNAIANNINRRVNPLWSQLSDDRLMISIIADGFHLLPEQIRVFYKVKGAERTIITSDVTRYAGMPPGDYLNAEGDTIRLTTDGAAIYVARNSLSGSASPISKGVGFVMQVTGCSLAEAIQMASFNPAKLYGLKDRGELKPGMRADLILFTMEDFQMKIKKTIVAGKVVYEAKN